MPITKFLVIKSDVNEELVIINCDQLDEKYNVVKLCEKSEQLCAFSTVSAFHKGKAINGIPLFISGEVLIMKIIF